MRNQGKRITRGFRKMSIIYISIIALLNMVGVGYGFWSNSVVVQTIISTGEIKAVFGNASIVYESSPQKIAWVSSNGNKMYIGMQNAFPGYSAIINYEVKNEGTIPVSCDAPEVNIEQTGNLLPVNIEVIPPVDTIKGYGESKIGTIIVRVEEENLNQNQQIQNMNSMEQNEITQIYPLNLPVVEKCGFSMKLLYHQDTNSD